MRNTSHLLHLLMRYLTQTVHFYFTWLVGIWIDRFANRNRQQRQGLWSKQTEDAFSLTKGNYTRQYRFVILITHCESPFLKWAQWFVHIPTTCLRENMHPPTTTIELIKSFVELLHCAQSSISLWNRHSTC